MSILTETMIDMADRHVVLGPFQVKKQAGPFEIWKKKSYVALHRQLFDMGAIPWPKSAGPSAGLKRLRAGYEDHKYWQRLLSSAFPQSYPTFAWQESLPILATADVRFDFPTTTSAAYRISPVMRAFIYPFGWSVWLSLRVTGEHSLQDLNSLVQSLVSAKPLVTGSPSKKVGLKEALTSVGAGIKSAVFGGANDVDTQDVLIVTTVLAKHGGSPSPGGMSAADQGSILRLVRPTGPPLTSLHGHIYQLNAASTPLEYIVYDEHGSFIWLEHLLDPIDLNHAHLRCYHNNTFRSLTQAWHMQGLLERGLQLPKLPAALKELMSTARRQLLSPAYENASLHEYLRTKRVVDVLALALKAKVP